MTDINQAGLEAAQLAIAKCKAVGRTTLADHAYDAVTAYLEATNGGGGSYACRDCPDADYCMSAGACLHVSEAAPQATDDDWETPCPDREDKQHCNCWYDGDKCCSCGDAASPEQPAPQATDDTIAAQAAEIKNVHGFLRKYMALNTENLEGRIAAQQRIETLEGVLNNAIIDLQFAERAVEESDPDAEIVLRVTDIKRRLNAVLTPSDTAEGGNR